MGISHLRAVYCTYELWVNVRKAQMKGRLAELALASL